MNVQITAKYVLYTQLFSKVLQLFLQVNICFINLQAGTAK